MKKYYSLREISAELGIPKSTVVKYKDYFTDFLKMAGDGKRKKFDESALEILKKIRDLRENRRLDWLEIKDILSQEYGAPDIGPEPAAARETRLTVPAPSAAAVFPKVDYIAHMVSVLGGQLMQMASAMEKSGDRTARNTKGIIVLAKRIVKVERKLDLVIAEMLNRDGKRLEELKRVAGGMRKEIDRVYIAIQHLSEELAKARRTPAAEAEAVARITSVVDKLGKNSALFQTRYQALLRENEDLKLKIHELSYKQEDKTEELPRRAGGLRSIFKRG